MSTAPLPPQPGGTLLGGNYREMKQDWLAAYTRYARNHGNVVAYRIGPVRCALITDPELIADLLLRSGKRLKKSSAEQMLRPLVGNGIFLSEGAKWVQQRRLVAPPFHRDAVRVYATTMVEVANNHMTSFAANETRDFYRDAKQIGIRIVSSTLFGAEILQDSRRVEEIFTEAGEAISARLDSALPLPGWVPTKAVRRIRMARAEIDRLIDEVVAQRSKDSDPAARTDLISLLMSARTSEKGEADAQLKDEAATLFLAGFETTAITIAWAIWLIATHPTVAAHVRAELDGVLAGRSPTADDLPRLTYLEQVVFETMRLYPPAWLFAREAIEDLEVGGYRIPKGWSVEFSQWVMHRDPRFWERPEEFLPERWADGLASRLPRFVYFPFGAGSRICIGAAFAKMEAMLVLAAVLFQFDVQPDGVDVTPDPGFILRPSPGVPLKLQRRAAAGGERGVPRSTRATA